MRDNLKLRSDDAAPVGPAEWAELRADLIGPASSPIRAHPPLLLYGVLIFCAGIAAYLFGVLLVFPRYLLGLNSVLEPVSEWIVWYSGVPIVAGVALALTDLLLFLAHKKPNVPVRYRPLANRSVTVALTAYNHEESIAAAKIRPITSNAPRAMNM